MTNRVIDYGITNRVDSSTVIIDIISFSMLYIYIELHVDVYNDKPITVLIS